MKQSASTTSPLHLDSTEHIGESLASPPAAAVGMSVLEVTFMQIAIILGLGVLGLSYAFASLGWVLGLLVLVLSAAGALYSGVWIARVVRHVTEQGGTPPRKYSDLGEACRRTRCFMISVTMSLGRARMDMAACFRPGMSLELCQLKLLVVASWAGSRFGQMLFQIL